MAQSIKKQHIQNPMWLYENNYIRLCDLFPNIVLGNVNTLQHDLEHSSLFVKIKEKNKYTLLLEVIEKYPVDSLWKQALNMRIRIYTDARLAEVVNYQGKTRFLPKYQVPNPKMYHRDEKHQINHLLYDWLLYLNRYLSRTSEKVIFL